MAREDESVRNPGIALPSTRAVSERFQQAMDEVRRQVNALHVALTDLEVYARGQAGEVRGQYISTEASRAYDDMADRIKALRGER